METEKTCCRGHKWLMVLAVLCLTTIVLVAILRDRIVSRTDWTVQVMGTGEIYYEADTANLSLGVSINNEKSASKAIADMTATTKKIVAAITKLGVAPEKFQTTNFNLMPHYTYLENISEVTGYDAEQTVMIKIEGIDANKELLGKIIEEASLVGANKVQGIEFTSSKIETLKQEARLLALADARSKAGATAAAANVKLDKVVGWWENMAYSGGFGKGGSEMAVADQAAIPSGQQKLKIEINVNYLLK